MAAVLDAVRAFFAPPAAPAFIIDTETPADVVAREALLDRAMGPDRRLKSSEKIRRDRVPAEGLAIVARDGQGHVIGTVRLWNVEAGVSREGRPVEALLLGPLAVDGAHEGKGIGSALMRAAMLEARRREHGAILLVGDAASAIDPLSSFGVKKALASAWLAAVVAFLDDAGVKLFGAEAAGHGIASGMHAASLAAGRPGVLHGNRTYVLCDDDGQITETHSVSAGLDYPGVGPEHAWLKDCGRAKYEGVTDDEALAAFHLLARTEGILAALESSHAVALGMKVARELPRDGLVLVNLSGRGDKDVHTIAKRDGITL